MCDTASAPMAVCGCDDHSVSLCDCPGQRWRCMAACVSICLYTFKKWNISFGSVSEAVSQLRLREAGGKLLG